MQAGLQKQHPQIKLLPAFNVNEKLRLQKADMDDLVKTVQSVLPQHVDEDTDLTITLLEKNLKIMADKTLMKEALTHLVRNAMDAMPGCGRFPLTIDQVNFGIESLRNLDDAIIGACAFISVTGVCRYIGRDEKIQEKMFDPFFVTKTDGNSPYLTVAYRIIKQHHERIKVKNRGEQSTEVTMYLPLNKLEIVNMMSIPVG